MNEKVIVNVKLSAGDVSAAIKEYFNRVLHLWVVPLCISLFIIGILISGIKDGFTVYINVLLSIFIFIFLFANYYYYLRPISSYQRIYQNRVETVFEISKDDIKISRNLSKSECKWDLFLGVYETKKYIYLMDQNKAMTFIPKKIISNDQLNQLRSIFVLVKKEKFKRYTSEFKNE